MCESSITFSVRDVKAIQKGIQRNRLEPWETLPLARLAKWQKRQQKKRVDAADDRVRGIDQLHEQIAYKDAVAGFYSKAHN